MLSQLIAGMVVIIISVALVPTVIEETNKAIIEMQPTDRNKLILQSIPFIFSLVIIFIVTGIAISALRKGEEMAMDYREDYEEQKKKDPNKKQTYKEYVEERLEVERMMN